MNRAPSLGRSFVALLVLIVMVPLGALSGLVAAVFLLDQVLSGWIPSRWFSSSAADWVFGAGTAGSARDYLGFMVTGVFATGCFKGAEWALRVLRGR